MAYTKQVWHNAPAEDTPVNATRLGYMEQGIFDAAETADAAEAAVVHAVQSTTITTIVKLTAAEYAGLGSPDPDTLYIVVG